MAKVKLGFHLDISAYYDIAKFSNIVDCISKGNKLKKRDRGWKIEKKDIGQLLVVLFFLATRPS